MARWTKEELEKLRPGMLRPEKPQPPRPVPPPPQETSLTRLQALGRLSAGNMNKTETRYAAQLEAQKAEGEILWWEFEPMNLRLGDDCFYRVDFMVMKRDGALEAHEVKGYWTDDALVKIKVAAKKFPFRFIAVRWVKRDWEVTEF